LDSKLLREEHEVLQHPQAAYKSFQAGDLLSKLSWKISAQGSDKFQLLQTGGPSVANSIAFFLNKGSLLSVRHVIDDQPFELGEIDTGQQPINPDPILVIKVGPIS
jgi:hypothetical protein